MSDAHVPDWPCQRSPDMWFSPVRRELGIAIHMCRAHCPRLVECGQVEARPTDGVLAGILYTERGIPSKKQPPAALCGGCVVLRPNKFTAPRPDPEEGCGTWTGVKRHQSRQERPCHPCAAFYNARRTERRRAKRAAA